MQVYNIKLDSIVKVFKNNLAIGNFDGLHLGHKEIIKKLISYSKTNNFSSAILSFDPHPRQFFSKDLKNFKIISEVDKIKLLDDLGVEYYFSLKFDSTIASLSPINFVKQILIDKLSTQNLVVGHDFQFGKDRKGNTKFLLEKSKELNFDINIIEPFKSNKNSEIFSSSKIRDAIKNGNFEKANLFLDRKWSMKGIVIEGDKRASKMNFPTANILPSDLILPKKGVYAIKSNYMNEWFNGIANFGERPTVNGKKLLLEVHLFDFNKNIYGKELTVQFLTFIREEKKFANFEILTEQIQQDIQKVKKYHAEI